MESPNFKNPIGVSSEQIHERNMALLEEKNPQIAQILKKLIPKPAEPPAPTDDFIITKAMRIGAENHARFHKERTKDD